MSAESRIAEERNNLLKEPNEKNDWELHDRLFSEEHMYTFVKAAAAAHQYYQTMKALPLMKEMHKGQFRKGEDRVPYINHPLMMACHILAMGIADDTILTVALMHDVCEDCEIAVAELPFDQQTKNGIAAMTHKKDPTLSRTDDLKKYYEQVRQDKYAAIVKVIDRCNNISLMATGFTKKKMGEYISETEEYVLPILSEIKYQYPEYYNAVFLLKYQMSSILESLKRIL